MPKAINKAKPYMLISFGITVVAGVLTAVIPTIVSSTNSVFSFQSEMWAVGEELFTVILPFLASAPFCWFIFYQEKSGFLDYVGVRENISKYLVKQYFAAISLAAAAITLICLADLLISLYCIGVPMTNIPSDELAKEAEQYVHLTFMGYYLVHEPLVYGSLLALWRGIIAALFAGMGFLLALSVRNLFVVLTAPFIYAIIEFQVAFGTMPYTGINYRAWIGSIQPFGHGGGIMTVPEIAVEALILLLMNAILAAVYVLHEKRDA